MAKRGPKIKTKIVQLNGADPTYQREPLTLESLRAYTGCEHYSDEEGKVVIQSLRTFASILLKNTLRTTAIAESPRILNLNQQMKAA